MAKRTKYFLKYAHLPQQINFHLHFFYFAAALTIDCDAFFRCFLLALAVLVRSGHQFILSLIFMFFADDLSPRRRPPRHADMHVRVAATCDANRDANLIVRRGCVEAVRLIPYSDLNLASHPLHAQHGRGASGSR
jgi:hypothetical protein